MQIWIMLGRVAAFFIGPFVRVYLRYTRRTRILIVVGGEFLVVQNWLSDGRWGLPGGGTKRTEQPVASVLRELFEEVGIELAEKPGLLARFKPDDAGIGFACDCFCVALSIKPVIRITRPFEITKYAWLPLTAVPTGVCPDVQLAVATYASQQ